MVAKEIKNEVLKLKQEVVLLKMQKNANTLKDTSKIRKKKKEIAVLLSKKSK